MAFDYTNWKEEIANAVTHGIGFLLSIPALVLLILAAVEKGTAWHIVSYTIFGVTMLLLYLFSTLLHSFKPSRIKKLFAILDHSAIYLLIAGTYTPFMLVSFRTPLGWTIFGIIWGLAIAGVVFKCYFVDRYQIISTIVYLLMGWMIIIAVKPLYEILSPTGFLLLLTGGIFYSIGAVFYVWNKLPYNHAIWHLFVLAGSTFMFLCVLLYV
ncbi:hemolysin III family protein [Rossellomorea vietnamensis]|uniref:Hemolysin III family protein n=2 Tax=Rossellomorea TaxID=2837508 RepID=A0A5D4KH32_9BACI|nr:MULTISPECIES: hemolysin III family protein [Rossellomorea]TYR76552.1 hemolysin III family protein [Rossellomorea vietnamensis]TYS79376.1 hemolysin III family protein [Rossellomorea aquimaris]